VFLVRGRSLADAASTLRGQPGITSVEPFGAGLHLQTDASRWDEARIARAVEAAGGSDVAVESSDPSLEDVFLAALGRAEEAA
jgi:hypothetical protein